MLHFIGDYQGEKMGNKNQTLRTTAPNMNTELYANNLTIEQCMNGFIVRNNYGLSIICNDVTETLKAIKLFYKKTSVTTNKKENL